MTPLRSAAADHAIASWVTGELTGALALAALCDTLAAPNVSCGLVSREREVVAVTGSRLSLPERQLLERVALATAPWRAFHKRSDDAWSVVVGDAPAGGSAAWLVCEPVGQTNLDSHAVLVCVGHHDAPRDEIMVRLPALAVACAAIVDAERTAERARDHAHSLKNGLAAILGNIEFACDLAVSPESIAANHADLLEAITHVREAAQRMKKPLEGLVTNVVGVRPQR